ncbi:MAG: hypothetical protein A2508_06475 [Candidatus Lambdaproteobacteria bacterium RIFOXYD12_FULL_49_8]|uniref:HPr domain-containing protein n=1 Tax=Candidatus Lambdaproteobacteria bacterium RIFOXYD2_FULL_50_16 TaxID=1817772 RepID=A0A1F6G9W5_9PROT|nr:MAG: hypothetical protein A2527_05155 [Candidatus Lambdaproteobacteria bacterium RIFOXYD2_FULL_50_16]OGG97458.1 MAG: hypothetical protein A2508_06475 [Candidatus Lambdaproteobacteria bacterium RIFOXYD12_FULL_49_8]
MKRELVISNKLGLHMRAASKLVQMASGLDPEISLYCNSQSADAKSLLDVLQLAATQGTAIVIEARGSDAEEEADALDQLCNLVNDKFGEGE